MATARRPPTGAVYRARGTFIAFNIGSDHVARRVVPLPRLVVLEVWRSHLLFLNSTGHRLLTDVSIQNSLGLQFWLSTSMLVDSNSIASHSQCACQKNYHPHMLSVRITRDHQSTPLPNPAASGIVPYHLPAQSKSILSNRVLITRSHLLHPRIKILCSEMNLHSLTILQERISVIDGWMPVKPRVQRIKESLTRANLMG